MTDTKTVFSVCGMCTVRCPIQVDVRDGEAVRVQGNAFSPLKGGLCARGAAGIALEQDAEKPQTPLIRVGERGEGKWRAVSWDEALVLDSLEFDFFELLDSVTIARSRKHIQTFYDTK